MVYLVWVFSLDNDVNYFICVVIIFLLKMINEIFYVVRIYFVLSMFGECDGF